jgi:hypothetical protein
MWGTAEGGSSTDDRCFPHFGKFEYRITPDQKQKIARIF